MRKKESILKIKERLCKRELKKNVQKEKGKYIQELNKKYR